MRVIAGEGGNDIKVTTVAVPFDAEVTQRDGPLDVKPLDLFQRLSIRGHALCDKFTATGSRVAPTG